MTRTIRNKLKEKNTGYMTNVLSNMKLCTVWKVETRPSLWKCLFKRFYLLDESCVATWMVSNVHITIMNGMITWKNTGLIDKYREM